uniref:Uncharacterized protein n=1 Tax=Pseudictyota dubia TaxID=2749911 RepID=A0A7R9W718_9STRA|mmetsp:Transcript_36640/g.67809  ORF Transcript_36640/g.67809 Transcript_36640/m.67809 type:complete len:203 (+) Transcript_36640:522-1130(+)
MPTRATRKSTSNSPDSKSWAAKRIRGTMILRKDASHRCHKLRSSWVLVVSASLTLPITPTKGTLRTRHHEVYADRDGLPKNQLVPIVTDDENRVATQYKKSHFAAGEVARLGRHLEDEVPEGDDWWFNRFQNDDGDGYQIFDDDAWHQKEVETKTNFFDMFDNAPSQWTSQQWAFFAVIMAVSSLLFCCILRCGIRAICPCL